MVLTDESEPVETANTSISIPLMRKAQPQFLSITRQAAGSHLRAVSQLFRKL